MLDVVPPEKIPVRIMPRVGVRDCAAQPTGGSSSTIGTDAAPTPRGRPRGRLRSVQTDNGGNGGDSGVLRGDHKGREKDGGGFQDDKNSTTGGGDGGDGSRRGKARVDAASGRSGKVVSKGGAATRRRKGSRSKRFFEMSATSQVRTWTATECCRDVALPDVARSEIIVLLCCLRLLTTVPSPPVKAQPT